jgi:hypothetical protein
VRKHLDYAIAMAVFAAALGFYSRQICPTFYFWDSAELAAAIASGGIPHPPGFPLYLILAKIFCSIVPYDIGMATSLFSAFCGSGAVAVFYLICQKLFNKYSRDAVLSRVMSLGVSICLAATASLTAQSTRAEVYSLNILMFPIAIYFLSDLFYSNKADKSKAKRFMIASLFLGLGLANHHLTIILVLPALIYLGLNLKFDFKAILASILALIIPITLYGYLVFLAAKAPDLNWGNPVNLGGLLAVITGKGFSTPATAFSIGHLSENFVFGLSLLYRQIGPTLAVLAIIGLIFSWRSNQKLSVFLLICVVFNLFSTIFNEYYYYENADIHGYLLISLVCIIIYSLMGLREVALKIRAKYARALAIIILVVAIIIPVYMNYGWADLSSNSAAKNLSLSYIEGCPNRSLVITSSYNSYFILKALQDVYGERKDLLVTNVYLFGQRWYREEVARRCNLQHAETSRVDARSFYRALINLYKDSSEIYIEYDDQSAPLKNYLVPSGLLMKFTAETTDWDKIDKAEFAEDDLKNIRKFVHSGMDYELLKGMILLLDGRAKFFGAIDQPELAAVYQGEIEIAVESAQK